jgi:hypothetical protein
MSQEHHPPTALDIAELVDADRELSSEEIDTLTKAAAGEWRDLGSVASGMLAERRRLRELWSDVERCKVEGGFAEAMERFTAGLGR